MLHFQSLLSQPFFCLFAILKLSLCTVERSSHGSGGKPLQGDADSNEERVEQPQ